MTSESYINAVVVVGVGVGVDVDVDFRLSRYAVRRSSHPNYRMTKNDKLWTCKCIGAYVCNLHVV